MNTTYLSSGALIKVEDFEVLADTIPHTVWMVTVDGRLEYVNRRGVEYYGQTANEIGANWIEFVHPDDVPAVMDAWTHMINDWRPPRVECRLRRHDGDYRWHRLQALALRDRSGKLRHWIGVGTDVDDDIEATISSERSNGPRTKRSGSWRRFKAVPPSVSVSSTSTCASSARTYCSPELAVARPPTRSGFSSRT